MLSLPLASADIISRRFVNWPGPAKKNIIKCEFKLFETLIWAETEGAGGPDLPMKIISCHLFPRRKTGTNLPLEAVRPPPVGIVWIRARMSDRNFIFYFLHDVAGLAIMLSRDNW